MGNTVFYFILTPEHVELIEGCCTLFVSVNYEHVPWYSWLPFFPSAHPSKRVTEETASFIHEAFKAKRSIFFWAMGYGLVPIGSACEFSNRDLHLFRENGRQLVLSYHEQV